jgi:hypothetical protein
MRDVMGVEDNGCFGADQQDEEHCRRGDYTDESSSGAVERAIGKLLSRRRTTRDQGHIVSSPTFGKATGGASMAAAPPPCNGDHGDSKSPHDQQSGKQARATLR